MNIHEIVEEIVGAVTWLSPDQGFCECPGKDFHTSPDHGKDSKVYLNGVPTLHCFHASCTEAREQANKRLRSEIATRCPDQMPKLTADELRVAKAHTELKEAVRKKAASARKTILTKHRWPYAEIEAQSPVALFDPQHHWQQLLGCFAPEDVVWIGGKYDSGPGHTQNFRPASEWLKEAAAPAQFICPATFRPGTSSRSNTNIALTRFLVVESDELTRDEVGAVFKWLRDLVQLNLRAVVDTAGKSLHAWFEYPVETTVNELRIVLPELGCDPKMFTPSQPARLPGADRDGKFQKLIYLGKEGVCAQ